MTVTEFFVGVLCNPVYFNVKFQVLWMCYHSDCNSYIFGTSFSCPVEMYLHDVRLCKENICEFFDMCFIWLVFAYNILIWHIWRLSRVYVIIIRFLVTSYLCHVYTYSSLDTVFIHRFVEVSELIVRHVGSIPSCIGISYVTWMDIICISFYNLESCNFVCFNVLECIFSRCFEQPFLSLCILLLS